jgi:hypothetical protein
MFSSSSLSPQTVLTEITTNLDTPALASSKKHVGTSHGLSMLGLSMLDPSHKGLRVEMKFTEQSVLVNTSEQLMAIWLKCESNKACLKSAHFDGKHLTEYFNVQLADASGNPISSIDFPPGVKVLIDADLYPTTQTYKFYRTGEGSPRELHLSLLPETYSIDNIESL